MFFLSKKESPMLSEKLFVNFEIKQSCANCVIVTNSKRDLGKVQATLLKDRQRDKYKMLSPLGYNKLSQLNISTNVTFFSRQTWIRFCEKFTLIRNNKFLKTWVNLSLLNSIKNTNNMKRITKYNYKLMKKEFKPVPMISLIFSLLTSYLLLTITKIIKFTLSTQIR